MRTHLKLGLIDVAKTFMLEERMWAKSEMRALAARLFAEGPPSNGSDDKYEAVKAQLREAYGDDAVNTDNKKRLRSLARGEVGEGAEGGGAEEETDVREAAKHLFEKMDTDQSGTMSHKEFRIGLEEFGMGLKKKDANKMLRSIDVDQCGEIDMEEWVAFFEMSEDDLRGRTIALANPTYALELSLPDISELLHTDTEKSGTQSPELKEGDNKFMNPLSDIDEIEAGGISSVEDGKTSPVGDGETSPEPESE